MVRCTCLLKRLAVTDLKADVTRLPKKPELKKAYEGALPILAHLRFRTSGMYNVMHNVFCRV